MPETRSDSMQDAAPAVGAATDGPSAPRAEQRVALVTGGASGIGAAIARALADDGRAVAIGDLNEQGAEIVAEELQSTGGTAVAVPLDVTDPASIKGAVETVAAELGPISILVNSAGWDELKPFLQTEERFWQKVIDVNFTGALRLTSAVLPGMVELGWGRVVNVSSDAGRVGSSGEAVYAGAKGAIIAFTKSIAREVARKGVTANAVCPGPTDTPLLSGIVEGSPHAATIIAAMTKAVPMKRLGRPEDVAGAAAFLASEQAGYITGQTLSVSGGLTMA